MEKEVLITLNQSNINYFEERGYYIPRYTDRYGVRRVQRGSTIFVKIEDLSANSRYLVTKICDDCGKYIPNQGYYRITRSRKKVDGKDRCGSCAQKMLKRGYENSLENWAKTNNKEYLLEEYSDKNNDSPSEIPYSYNGYRTWNCKKCMSEFDSKVGNRTVGNTNCPYCVGQKVNHTNCLWTTHPEIAKLLEDPPKGYEITAGASNKEFFTCPECKDVSLKYVRNVVRFGLGCTKCSDGLSYSEKFFIKFLSQLGVNFKTQVSFDWSQNRRYDFYLLNCIIEVHGEQHYKESFKYMDRGRTLKEERENDALKEALAKGNGIDEYVIIDCRKSNMEWIKENILQSNLNLMFDLSNINWLACHEFACNTLVKTVCDIYNNGIKVTTEIAKIVGLERSTVGRYLKQGVKLNWCDYDPKHPAKPKVEIWANSKSVIQLTKNNKFIKEWNSISEASRALNISHISIIKTCKGEINSGGNFVWMYKNDYEKTKDSLPDRTNTNFYTSEVVQLTLEGEFIKEWSSMIEASKTLGIKSSGISLACRGNRRRAGNFLWRYKSEYVNNKEEIKPYRSNNSKEIVQLTKENELIGEFKSISEASKNTGFGNSNISSALRGKSKTANGFKWMYKEDYESVLKERVGVLN